MKISGLDFLSDLETRLLGSLGDSPEPDSLEFQRLLNFSEKTMVLKIGWPDLPLGKLACRMIEETQDFYFRGTFLPASGDRLYSFTLRPGKDYEKDISLLVEVIARTVGGTTASVVPAETPSTGFVSESSSEAPSTDLVTEIPSEAPSTDLVTETPSEAPSTDLVTEIRSEAPSTDVVSEAPSEASGKPRSRKPSARSGAASKNS